MSFDLFDEFLQKEKFDNVIEIGTAFGGLCLFLYEKSLEYNYNFMSFDIADRIYDKHLTMGRIVLDIFSEDAINIVKKQLENGKCLILCDGGNKIKEFNFFYELLKPNDFIMAHDYAKSVEHFNNNIKDTYWNWCEIIDSDVAKALENLQKYKDIDFEKCAWLCCEKQ